MSEIKLIITFSFISFIAAAQKSEEAPKYAAAGKQTETIKLLSKENNPLVIPWELISRLGLVKSALENDAQATEVPIPGVTTAQLNLIISALVDNENNIRSESQIRSYINEHINLGNINAIYKAVDYLGVGQHDDLFKLLAEKYAELIHEFLQLSKKEQDSRPMNPITRVKDLVNSKYYLPMIAKSYFLKYADDIDGLLGVKTKPTAKEMRASGILLPVIFERSRVSLDEDPDQIIDKWSIPPLTPLQIAIQEEDFKSIKSLIKLGAHLPEDITETILGRIYPTPKERLAFYEQLTQFIPVSLNEKQLTTLIGRMDIALILFFLKKMSPEKLFSFKDVIEKELKNADSVLTQRNATGKIEADKKTNMIKSEELEKRIAMLRALLKSMDQKFKEGREVVAKKMVEQGLLSPTIYFRAQKALGEDPNQIIDAATHPPTTAMSLAIADLDMNSIKSLLKLGAVFGKIRLTKLLNFNEEQEWDAEAKKLNLEKLQMPSAERLAFVKDLITLGAQVDFSENALIDMLLEKYRVICENYNTLKDLVEKNRKENK